jgi:hypothetical protein
LEWLSVLSRRITRSKFENRMVSRLAPVVLDELPVVDELIAPTSA